MSLINIWVWPLSSKNALFLSEEKKNKQKNQHWKNLILDNFALTLLGKKNLFRPYTNPLLLCKSIMKAAILTQKDPLILWNL